MRIEKSLLTGLGVSETLAEKYLSAMNEALAEHGIDTPLRVAHFLSQVLHESGKMKFVEENLNYSADGLSKIFGKYFKTTAEAEAYARNREKIGSRVYGNRMGNGPEATGEGIDTGGAASSSLPAKTTIKPSRTGSTTTSWPTRIASRTNMWSIPPSSSGQRITSTPSPTRTTSFG